MENTMLEFEAVCFILRSVTVSSEAITGLWLQYFVNRREIYAMLDCVFLILAPMDGYGIEVLAT